VERSPEIFLMFTKETVFILGAGASWHYGYPTGETLVKKVIDKAAYACRYFEHCANDLNRVLPNFLQVEHAKEATDAEISEKWRAAFNACSDLKAGLERVNPLVIDYYLGWNAELQSIGKLLIAWVILECEHVHQREAWKYQSKGNAFKLTVAGGTGNGGGNRS